MGYGCCDCEWEPAGVGQMKSNIRAEEIGKRLDNLGSGPGIKMDSSGGKRRLSWLGRVLMAVRIVGGRNEKEEREAT